MEKILRRKFVMISVSVAFVVVFGMVLVLNITNRLRLEDNLKAVMYILADHGGTFPNKPVNPYPNVDLPQEFQYTTRYFTVNLDDENNVLSIDTRNINIVDSFLALEYAKDIVNSNKIEGFYENFKYRSISTEYGKMIIFVDCEADLMSLRSFFYMSLEFSLGMLVVFAIIMIFVSKFAVAPIVQSYKKQQQFITDISHELKTPLAIIKTNTEVIEMIEPSEWTDSIHNQINRLSQLVNYLISLSKMEEQSVHHLKNDFSLSEAVAEAIDTFSVVAQGENKEIIYDIQPDMHFTGDEQSIRMLISILIDNSIKYSIENTKITVTLREKRSRKVLKISNYAENLKVENYNRLFERFYRLDDSRNSKTGGFGIGLATAKAIVKSHSGDIKAESLDAKQITFTVEF